MEKLPRFGSKKYIEYIIDHYKRRSNTPSTVFWQLQYHKLPKHRQLKLEKIFQDLVNQKILFVTGNSEEFGRKQFYYYEQHFKITFEKGIWYFEHPTRGKASFDMNTNIPRHEGAVKSLATYFSNYSSGFTGYRRYYGHSKKLLYDFAQAGDYGKFIATKVIPNFYRYTRKGYGNVGNMLPHFKQFENMYNWKNAGFNLNFITDINPSILPKYYRHLLKNNNVTLSRSMLAIMQNDIEYFKQLLSLLEHERVPTEYREAGRYNYYRSSNNWEDLLESEDLRCLVKQEGYEIKAILRYIFNYIKPYEKMNISTALEQLRDYASMHRQMEIKDFKRYPKYLKSNHDIIAGEYNSFKKEYQEEIFAKKINQELMMNHFIEKKDKSGNTYKELQFTVEVPMLTDHLRMEGKLLNHCVGSYIERIMNDETQIVFLRKHPGIPMVTLEIRDNVLIQAKGYANRNITKEEKRFLNVFAKEKNLLVRV